MASYEIPISIHTSVWCSSKHYLHISLKGNYVDPKKKTVIALVPYKDSISQTTNACESSLADLLAMRSCCIGNDGHERSNTGTKIFQKPNSLIKHISSQS